MTVAGELTKLWKAGAYTLPNAAAQYGRAGGSVNKTGGSDESAFARTQVDGNFMEPMGPDMALENTNLGKLQPQWTRLRDTLQNRIIHQTRENLVKAGEALVQVANDYAERDDEARDALDKETQKLRGHEPVVPGAPTHHTPKPKDSYDNPSGDAITKPSEF